MSTDIVVYEEVKPLNDLKSIEGFLRDNSGGLWSISKRSVEVLTEDDVKPFEEVVYNGKLLPVWVVDKGGERYYNTTAANTTRHVNKCVFDAVKKYTESLSLGTLTSGDQKFFTNHPRVSSDGVNRANVLIVSQGLIGPWGLGIDRVWVPKLSSVGPQQEEFMKALGVNPVALTDYETSNEDLIKLLELDPKGDAARQIRDSYRFEFSDEPGRPCVVMMSSSVSKKSSANVGGAWSATVSGFGHADFIGPRDTIHGTWEIAFSISRNPVYINGTDMSAYSEMDYFDDEIKAMEEAEKNKPKELSTWSSIIGGKSISDRNKKQTPAPKVSTYKPPYQQQSFNWANRKKDDDAKSNGKIETRKKETCPDCGESSIKHYDDYAFCMKCNWWEELGDEDTYYKCPFCGAKMLSNGMCPTCMFDDEIWRKSQIFSCNKHSDYDVYFSSVGPDFEKLDSKDFVYACPLCLKEEDVDLDQFYKAGGNHKKDMTAHGKTK